MPAVVLHLDTSPFEEAIKRLKPPIAVIIIPKDIASRFAQLDCPFCSNKMDQHCGESPCDCPVRWEEEK